MPHVSKHKPDHDTHLDTFLLDCIGVLSTKGLRKSFVTDFFTSVEKIMLAKRLAIIISLIKEKPFNEIENKLKVSPSTVARYQKELWSGKYEAIKVLNAYKDSHTQSIVENLLDWAEFTITAKHGRRR